MPPCPLAARSCTLPAAWGAVRFGESWAASARENIGNVCKVRNTSSRMPTEKLLNQAHLENSCTCTCIAGVTMPHDPHVSHAWACARVPYHTASGQHSWAKEAFSKRIAYCICVDSVHSSCAAWIPAPWAFRSAVLDPPAPCHSLV